MYVPSFLVPCVQNVAANDRTILQMNESIVGYLYPPHPWAPKMHRKPPSSRLQNGRIFKQFYKYYWQHYCFCHAWGASNQRAWLSSHHRFDKRHLITWYSHYDWTKIQFQNVQRKNEEKKKTPRNCVTFVRVCSRAQWNPKQDRFHRKHTTRCDRMKCSISFLLRQYFSKISQFRVCVCFFLFFLSLVFWIQIQ